MVDVISIFFVKVDEKKTALVPYSFVFVSDDDFEIKSKIYGFKRSSCVTSIVQFRHVI